MFESDHPTLPDLQRYHRELDAAKNFYTDLYFNALLLQEEVGEVSGVLGRQKTTCQDHSATSCGFQILI